MSSRRPFTSIAAVIFGLVALAHLYRLATHLPVTIGAHSIPQGASWIGLFVAGGLSLMLFREARR